MNPLINNFSRDILEDKLSKEPFSRKTVSFYRYIEIQDLTNLRNELYAKWESLGILGRVYIAQEGINAQISVPEPNWQTFVDLCQEYDFTQNIRLNVAVQEPKVAFIKLTIKIKKQIVADGLEHGEYDLQNIGKHLNVESWNQAMEDPETVIVDMRNHYESRIGHFENAITPDVDTFREQLPMVKDMLADKKDKKILLYCTGGVRCEKASAYLKHHGFEDVNQLEGGIIKYARDAKEQEMPVKFRGKNFVFDERLAESISDEIISECDQCEKPSDNQINCKNEICHLLFIQCEDCNTKYHGCCSQECYEFSLLPVEERRKLRKEHRFRDGMEMYSKRLRPNLKELRKTAA